MIHITYGIFHWVDLLLRDPQAILYYLQALTYALAFQAMRGENHHPPCIVYLVSSAVHASLGALHQLPHG